MDDNFQIQKKNINLVYEFDSRDFDNIKKNIHSPYIIPNEIAVIHYEMTDVVEKINELVGQNKNFIVLQRNSDIDNLLNEIPPPPNGGKMRSRKSKTMKKHKKRTKK